MSSISERVAEGHFPTTPIQCTCGHREDGGIALHIAAVTEALVREQVDRLLESEWQMGYVAGNNDQLNGTICGRRAAQIAKGAGQ